MPGERGATRAELIEGARAELLAVGQAEFTMEGVARRSFYSVGSVYNHWPERAALLADLANDVVLGEVEDALAGMTDSREAISWALDEGRPTLILMGELLLAGHGDERLAEPARTLWRSLQTGLDRYLPPSMAWYVATCAVGNALLDVVGMPGPQPPVGRLAWLTEACEVEQADIIRTIPVPPPTGGFEVPVVPSPSRDDPTTIALIEAAQSLLTQSGAEGASARSIATAAGVTTGAVYRRYEAKSQLFADVLLVELSPDRYTWTWDLVRALAGDDPYRGAAEVMTRQLFARNADVASQRVLLQIGVAARNDPVLREQVHQRIDVAHQARRDMFAHFADVGLMRGDVDPAVLAWGFQSVPVGVRVVLPLGIDLDPDMVGTAMHAILTAAAGR